MRLNLAAVLLLGIQDPVVSTAATADIWITQSADARSSFQVKITNAGDRAICLHAGDDARAFAFTRSGSEVEIAPRIPLLNLRNRCLAIEPGASLQQDYDLAIAYPDLRRDDRVCFIARLWFKGDPEISTPTVACRLLD